MERTPKGHFLIRLTAQYKASILKKLFYFATEQNCPLSFSIVYMNVWPEIRFI